MKKNLLSSLSDVSVKRLPDKLYLRLMHRNHAGVFPNFKNPQTFTEKIQWLKLYDRNPKYINLVDKFEVRSHIKEVIGENYLIPLLASYENVEDINWDELPNKFVIKCTHGSHCHIICEDKKQFDIANAKMKLNNWLGKNWFWYGREWPYKNVPPRIIFEEFIENELIGEKNLGLTDYKFYCFNGTPTFCQVIKEGENGETIDFFDCDWKKMEFTGLKKTARKSNDIIERPKRLEEMVQLARKLSEEFAFVRVDLYFNNGEVYFGELTFYPQSGFGKFQPLHWNLKIGKLLDLPRENNY